MTRKGLAYGTVTSMLNLACAIFPLIVAALYISSDDKYIPNVEYFFASLGMLGTALGILLMILDQRSGNPVLNKGNRDLTHADRLETDMDETEIDNAMHRNCDTSGAQVDRKDPHIFKSVETMHPSDIAATSGSISNSASALNSPVLSDDGEWEKI